MIQSHISEYLTILWENQSSHDCNCRDLHHYSCFFGGERRRKRYKHKHIMAGDTCKVGEKNEKKHEWQMKIKRKEVAQCIMWDPTAITFFFLKCVKMTLVVSAFRILEGKLGKCKWKKKAGFCFCSSLINVLYLSSIDCTSISVFQVWLVFWKN